jgi:hypothetical protein
MKVQAGFPLEVGGGVIASSLPLPQPEINIVKAIK